MFPRYIAVSTLALAIDYTLLLTLTNWVNQSRATVAAFSYLTGAVIHYFLSRCYVFGKGWLNKQSQKELGAFLLTCLIGTAITSLIISINEKFTLANLLWAKTFAVGLSFVTLYFLRKLWVFRKSG